MGNTKFDPGISCAQVFVFILALTLLLWALLYGWNDILEAIHALFA